jgi:predicted amidohydrolase YtcJ
MDFPMSTMDSVFHKARWRDAYLWKTLRDHGAPLAFASDWPVTDVSVMRGIQAALTRTPYEGCGDERVSLMDTLYAYTAGGAWAGHLDGLTGRLTPGLAADLVMIDGDIETIPAEQIGQTGIALTVSGGRITHQGQGFAG